MSRAFHLVASIAFPFAAFVVFSLHHTQTQNHVQSLKHMLRASRALRPCCASMRSQCTSCVPGPPKQRTQAQSSWTPKHWIRGRSWIPKHSIRGRSWIPKHGVQGQSWIPKHGIQGLNLRYAWIWTCGPCTCQPSGPDRRGAFELICNQHCFSKFF